MSLLHAQLSHCLGLNDLCDSLQLHSGPLSALRGATAPSHNGLSHANRERPAAMAEQLFWRMLEHLKEQSPGFGAGKRRGPAFRFKMPIQVIDSTTMELVANCMDWAKHRRRKAAAKTHRRLNLQSLLPAFVIVDTAAEHDNLRARELCAGLKSGEIALFDKGYVDFGHLRDLDERGIFWVTRAKENMAYEVVKKMPQSKDDKILKDEMIVLRQPNQPAPEVMRRVVALAEVDGEEREMIFLTNNLARSPRSVADLYRCRWQLEVFFKQIKQTLQLADFLGHNANAVRWQVWTALLVYVNVKKIAAGGDHTLALVFTPTVQYYPLDVSQDMLLIYNTNSVDSSNVWSYYMQHRPMIGNANVLGIGCVTNEIVGTNDLQNQILTPLTNWLAANPTKRPQYVVIFFGVPTMANISQPSHSVLKTVQSCCVPSQFEG